MNIVAGAIIFPLCIASILVHGLGIILGLAGSLSRPYRIWFVSLLVVVSVDAVIFLQWISA